MYNYLCKKLYHAIYFLSGNIDPHPLIRDFAEPSKIRYAAPHILFTYLPNDSVITAIQNAEGLKNRIQTLQYLCLTFKPIEPCFFVTDTANAFRSPFCESSPEYSQWPIISNQIVSSLISFFLTIKAKPQITFLTQPPRLSQIVGQFIDQFDAILNEYLPNDKTFWIERKGNTKHRRCYKSLLEFYQRKMCQDSWGFYFTI